MRDKPETLPRGTTPLTEGHRQLLRWLAEVAVDEYLREEEPLTEAKEARR